MDFPRQYRLYVFTLFSFSLIQVLYERSLWREPIVFRKVSMAFSFYPIKYNVWAERCFVYSRYRGNCYISEVPKAPPTGREWMCISIIQSVVFVQTNAKIHPHKPVLNNIIIYTSDSSLFFKSSVVRFFILQLINFFVKTCISMVNELVFRGLQH